MGGRKFTLIVDLPDGSMFEYRIDEDGTLRFSSTADDDLGARGISKRTLEFLNGPFRELVEEHKY